MLPRRFDLHVFDFLFFLFIALGVESIIVIAFFLPLIMLLVPGLGSLLRAGIFFWGRLINRRTYVIIFSLLGQRLVCLITVHLLWCDAEGHELGVGLLAAAIFTYATARQETTGLV